MDWRGSRDGIDAASAPLVALVRGPAVSLGLAGRSGPSARRPRTERGGRRAIFSTRRAGRLEFRLALPYLHDKPPALVLDGASFGAPRDPARSGAEQLLSARNRTDAQ